MTNRVEEIKKILQSWGSCTASYDDECTFQDAHKSWFWDKTVEKIVKVIDKNYITKQQAKKIRDETLDGLEELVSRLELEFERVVCDCGEPYKGTDPHDVVKELRQRLESTKREQNE